MMRGSKENLLMTMTKTEIEAKVVDIVSTQLGVDKAEEIQTVGSAVNFIVGATDATD
jgi:hypothetical protein